MTDEHEKDIDRVEKKADEKPVTDEKFDEEIKGMPREERIAYLNRVAAAVQKTKTKRMNRKKRK